MTIFEKKLFWKINVGFLNIGDPILNDEFSIIIKSLPIGDYQWVVKDAIGGNTISADYFTMATETSKTISWQFVSPDYEVGQTYYFGLENLTTLEEGLQVSFTLDEEIVLIAGQSVVNYFTSQFTASGNPIDNTTNKIQDSIGGQYKYEYIISRSAPADFICDGVADQIQINEALDFVNSISSIFPRKITFRKGDFIVNAGIKISSATLLNVEISAEKGTRILPAVSGMTENVIFEFLGKEWINVDFSGFEIDCQNRGSTVPFRLSKFQTFKFYNNTIKNINAGGTSRWATILGDIDSLTSGDLLADRLQAIEDSASYDLEFYNNLYENNYTKTFEVNLFLNVRRAKVYFNRYKDNLVDSNNYSEVSIAPYCQDFEFFQNTQEGSDFNFVGALYNKNVSIFLNTTKNIGNGSVGIRTLNQRNCKIWRNDIDFTGSPDNAIGVKHYDRTDSEWDGHPVDILWTEDWECNENKIRNAYYGIESVQTGANVINKQKRVKIFANDFWNIKKAPIRWGSGLAGTDIDFLWIDKNKAHDWTGTLEGAITLIGEVGNASGFKNVYVRDNFTADNPATNAGSLRFSAVSVKEVSGNSITSTGSYGAISLVNSATIELTRDNIGYTTENFGTATIANGTTTIAVSHGLSKTPTAQNISITPTNNLGNATKFWVSNVTATQFTINVNIDPAGSGATFAWNVEVK